MLLALKACHGPLWFLLGSRCGLEEKSLGAALSACGNVWRHIQNITDSRRGLAMMAGRDQRQQLSPLLSAIPQTLFFGENNSGICVLDTPGTSCQPHRRAFHKIRRVCQLGVAQQRVFSAHSLASTSQAHSRYFGTCLFIHAPFGAGGETGILVVLFKVHQSNFGFLDTPKESSVTGVVCHGACRL